MSLHLNRADYESRIRRDVAQMTVWYPQFHPVVRPSGPSYWSGVLRPFRSRFQTFHVAIVYSSLMAGIPRVWCTQPEISKRTHPYDPHINVDGSLCTFFVPDRTYDPHIHDISHLVDLTADWLRRYVFFTEFGYWPGKEAPHDAASVLKELRHREDVQCVCGSGLMFRQCCASTYRNIAAAQASGMQLSTPTGREPHLVAATLSELRNRLGIVALARLLPFHGPPAELLG